MRSGGIAAPPRFLVRSPLLNRSNAIRASPGWCFSAGAFRSFHEPPADGQASRVEVEQRRRWAILGIPGDLLLSKQPIRFTAAARSWSVKRWFVTDLLHHAAKLAQNAPRRNCGNQLRLTYDLAGTARVVCSRAGVRPTKLVPVYRFTAKCAPRFTVRFLPRNTICGTPLGRIHTVRRNDEPMRILGRPAERRLDGRCFPD